MYLHCMIDGMIFDPLLNNEQEGSYWVAFKLGEVI